MKRSEMVEKLRNKMEDSLGDFFSMQEASSIIEFLESCGMKPPVAKKCPVLHTTEHVWEKESAGGK